MIRGTVALPVWNSHRILWLCMESLCRQIKPIDGWELIVFEGRHLTQVGERYIRGFEDRLKLAGCERVHYIAEDTRLPLSRKWVMIANEASETSEYFCLCAADNYYQPWMLCDAEDMIKQADWCLTTRGYFYDFFLNKLIMYHYNSIIGLQMIAKTYRVRQFPLEEKWRGVDSWFANQMRHLNGQRVPLACFIDGSEHWQHTLCTNGLNNISTERWRFFQDVKPPFYDTDKLLCDIVPMDIYDRLIETRQSLMTSWANDDMGQIP